MQWFGGRESDNVEEGSSSGGGRGLFFGGGIIGFIGLLIYLFTGVNPAQLFNGQGGADSTQQNTRVTNGAEGTQKKFARVVLAGTEDVWTQIFSSMNRTYTKPTLHLYSEGVQARGCGFASSATGPFYCPADQKVYLDTSFFAEMQQRFQAPGEFAAAYVIAHEVGHHVQNLLGISQKMDEARQRLSQTAYNKLSVKLELQADFYAGVWAHYEAKSHQNNIIINRSDIDSALVAAHAIGDDRLQQKYQGRVEPDSFTHGTSKQRAYWFKKGFDTGDINQGNTFTANDLEEEQ
ncbi:zinc metallopeptidase [Mucilaginibacter sp. BJC16-A38]|uniref:KPN_02809 family neutral zinc metallopeptidase n=1 Tax=Mucilaginibacter phenanthrenivorans TaxID=1234842 RepID=UPI002158481A|nr:neutral zinc metallopeptidase [Mucilaginibacter phenanthrenivorans]MCR8559188.1 zinc metallopeptidase [Mucilaginibacter phenanthrenivorans]